MTEKAIRIELPTDEDGFLPRQCSHCEQRFSIHGETFQDQYYLNLRCPYCGFIEEFDQYLTDEQAEYSQATTENEALEVAAEEFEDAIRDAFGGSTSGSFDLGERDVPSPHLPVTLETVSCSGCNFRYGVLPDQSDSLCPVCR